MPVVEFGGKSRSYKRWYTRFVGVGADAVEKLVEIAMTRGDWWRAEIEKWQQPTVDDGSLPQWYRSALFNESYYLVDGSAVWFDYDSSWKEQETEIDPLTEEQLRNFGRFGYMESWEYLMFNTYDVHFYASWCLLKNWPQLELSMQLEFCDQLNREDSRRETSLKDGKRMEIKTISRIPHDMGNPNKEPSREEIKLAERMASVLKDFEAPQLEVDEDVVVKNPMRGLHCESMFPEVHGDLCLEEQSRFGRPVAVNEECLLELVQQDPRRCSRELAEELECRGEPWVETNAYVLHDTAEWRDLNLKFVLSCWRDYKMIVKRCCESKAADILQYFYSQSEIIVRNALNDWDHDDDGMIENSGAADQTYDVWKMTGTSAYCGSLWLAALWSITCMAEELGEVKAQQYFEGVMERAKQAFVRKLWNGRYFTFDESPSNRGVIMADQLCGVWFQRMMGEETLISEAQVLSTLDAIYEHNVKMFASGEMGPVNGMLRSDGFDTAGGMFNTCWYRLGLQYQTPEAIYEKRYYRAIGYMRPLAVWAMQHALENSAS
ncbi:unnamed protein product [Heligmosomoides polygyrus]|uniref:DUF608 domain-containing protein n=1 Tax=Heligmosomoides polygyrus TaxID=6339 RepID=A0A183FMW1_HELPZ|nr:unnamed protein product [Heligmosomoides polygyrus]